MKLEAPLGRAAERLGAGSRPLPIRRIGVLMAAGLLSVVVGYVGYGRFAAPAPAAVSLQTAVAGNGSLVSTVTSSGSVVATHLAKLSFSADGKLVEMNVAIGARVKAGQLLARQDPAPLQSKLVSAESALKVAQIGLDQLKAGATPEELDAAQIAYDLAASKYQDTVAGATEADKQTARAAVDTAKASLAAAQVKLDELKAGPAQIDLLSARGAVDTAKASITSAQAKLDQVKTGATATDLSSAQAAVETGRSNLASAQEKLKLLLEGPTASDLAAAQASVQQAKTSMMSAEDRYQMVENGDLGEAGGTSSSAVQQAYASAKANYDSAVAKLQELQKGPTAADLQSAQSAVTSAQASYDSAQAKLQDLQKGPTTVDITSAEGSVLQSQVSLANAQAKLDDLLAGPTDTELASAQSTVDQAAAALVSAQTKLNDLLAGPTESDLLSARSSLASAKVSLSGKTTVKETDVILQEEKVRQAQAALDQARLDLDSATMAAPFDGTISAVAVNAGERVASNATVLTLVDPTAFRIDVTVDESDVTKLALDQPVAITFDSLPDQRLQGKVISVAPSGTTSQGVVSYPVSIAVDSPKRTFPAGMSASVSIETERLDNVLLVPNRAVRTQGRNKMVEVMVDEKTETRTVQTGSSNDQFTQITSGLKQGDVVVIPSTTIRSTSTSGGPGGGPGMPGGGGGVVIRQPGR